MAYLEVSDYGIDYITVTIGGLDTSYERDDREVIWYLNNQRQDGSYLWAGTSSYEHTFSGLQPDTTYSIDCVILYSSSSTSGLDQSVILGPVSETTESDSGGGGGETTTYDIYTSVDPYNSGSVSASCTTGLPYGTTISIKATPNDGYTFSYWGVMGDYDIGSGTSAETTLTVYGNLSVIAYFERVTYYSLSVTASPSAYGTVRASQTTNISAGASVNIYATAKTGYRFVNWTIMGSGVITNSSNPNTSVRVNGNVSLIANFEKITYSLSVKANNAAYGKATATEKDGYWEIKATPNAGYKFDSWNFDYGSGLFGDSSSTSTIVVISEDSRVVANFSPITYNLTIQANDDKGGEVFAETNAVPATDNRVWIAASPNKGYKFSYWEISGAGGIDDKNNVQTYVTVNGDVNIIGYFVKVRPEMFDWTYSKIQGKPFNLTATEWNDLTKNINEVLIYADVSERSFTSAVKGEPFTAGIYNEAVSAIQSVNGYESAVDQVESGDPVTASLMNDLVFILNSIQ